MGGPLFVEWMLLVGVMALGQFSPGPDMILLTRVSLRDGCRAGWLVMLGIVTGLSLHAALAIVGISALLSQEGVWEQWLSVTAACYLFWLGWQMMREFLSSFSDRRVEVAGNGQGSSWYIKGLLCNLLNPKVVLFFAALTSLFLKGEREGWWPYVIWITIVFEGALLWGLWVLVLQRKEAQHFYERYRKWLELAFGIGLWVLAVLLLAKFFQ